MKRHVFMLLAGVAVASLLHAQDGKMAVTTSSEEARSEFIAGRTLVDNLRLTDAASHFQKAVELDPAFALAHLYLAQTAPTPKEFFAHLKQADELSAKVSPGEQLWIRGVRAGAYGDAAGQRKIFEELAAKFPRDERARTLLGITCFAQQDYQGAIDNLKQATEINPAFANAYNQLGYAYRFLNRYDDAEKIFKKYTELIPHDPNPYDSYAELLLRVGRFDESIVQYRTALEINRYFANSYAGIAAALAYQGKYQQAHEILGTALDLARTDAERRGALFAKTVVYLDEGNPKLALKEVEKQYDLGKNSNDAPAMAGDLVLQGNIILEAGKPDEALKNYAKAAGMIQKSSLAPQVRENAALVYHYNAGRAAVAKNDLALAAKEAQQFRKGAEAKKNVNQIRLANELDGMIALASGEYRKAVDLLQGANQQNPYNLYRMAVAQKALGNTAEAKELCTSAARFYVLPQPNFAFVRTKAEKMLQSLAGEASLTGEQH
jgi:tetratricopeptide (TPR) repeat protein